MLKHLILFTLAATIITGCEKKLIPSYSDIQPNWRELHGPFILSRWTQDGPYAEMTPGHNLLGCWSVAFAQVLAYHRLQPSGIVSYRTNGGVDIDEVLDHPVVWENIVSSIEPDTPAEKARETALYCYHMSVVIRKDFGRGEYMNITHVPNEITEHYGCLVERMEISSGNDLADTVRYELRAARPLIAYFDDILDIGIVRNGHAMIIDGAAMDGDRLYVHIGCGWGGAGDGWYDFHKLAKERELLYVFRVVP